MSETLCAILCNLYLSAGAAYLNTVHAPPCQNCAWYHDITRPKNPYGVLAVGWETPQLRGLSAGLEARHMSSTSSGKDAGVDTIEARLTWRPFAR